MIRYDKDINWFEMWFSDRKEISRIMRENMQSDLKAGYDSDGISIKRQQVMIYDYDRETDRQLDAFKFMDEEKINHWCFYDMIKRGVIE